MNADQLQGRLKTILGDSFASQYAAFRQQSQVDDPDAFAIYLLNQKIITQDQCFEAYESAEVEISGAERLAETLVTLTYCNEPAATYLLDSDVASNDAESRDAAEGASSAADQTDTADPEAGVTDPGGETYVMTSPTDAQAAIAAAQSGSTGSQYDLLGLLGQGGLGDVHLARHTHLQRKVAYKALRQQAAGNLDLTKRFLSEAQITAQLEHPNIVPLYTLEVQSDGQPAYAMKLVQGRELTDIIAGARAAHERGESLDDQHKRTVRLEHFLKVCDAIAYAHAKGVIHRDLKPANIMIGRYNELYVIDWGIARLMKQPQSDAEQSELTSVETEDLTQMGRILGTPRYMSPEQATGLNEELDGRSDLYSLGLILQELVTLQRAVDGHTLNEALKRARIGRRAPIRHLQKQRKIPAELRAIIEKATAVDRADRYNTVVELSQDVRRFLRNEATLALPDNLYRRTRRWIGHHQSLTLAVIFLLLLAGAGLVIATLIQQQSAQQQEQDLIARLHEEERRRSQLLKNVAAQMHRIDNQLQSYQALLYGTATAAAEVLTHASDQPRAVYFDRDFGAPQRAPPDLVKSDFYQRPVSTNWPVVQLAPQVEAATVASEINRLVQIQPLLKQVLLKSAELSHGETKGLGSMQLLVNDSPIRRVAITLESGIHLAYPGMGGYDQQFDGRRLPTYALAQFASGMQWGRSYLGPDDRQLMLPSSTAIRDRDGQFIGAANVELSLNYIDEHLLHMADVPAVEETMLVNGLGIVMIHSDDTQRVNGRSYFMPYPEVMVELKTNEPGFVETEEDGKPLIIVFLPLQSVPWYYVAVVAQERLLGEDGDAAEDATDPPIS